MTCNTNLYTLQRGRFPEIYSNVSFFQTITHCSCASFTKSSGSGSPYTFIWCPIFKSSRARSNSSMFRSKEANDIHGRGMFGNFYRYFS